MKNVTLSIEEDDLKQARIKALQHGTSLNAVIRDFIKRYINRDTHYQQLTQRLIKYTENGKGFESRRDWTRDDLYNR